MWHLFEALNTCHAEVARLCDDGVRRRLSLLFIIIT